MNNECPRCGGTGNLNHEKIGTPVFPGGPPKGPQKFTMEHIICPICGGLGRVKSQGMTPEELAEIKARAEAATPGPWWFWWEPNTARGENNPTLRVHGCRIGEIHGLSAEDVSTAEFIAHAREDVPALIAEVERFACERDANFKLARYWQDEAEKAEAKLAAIRKAAGPVVELVKAYKSPVMPAECIKLNVDYVILCALAEAIKEECLVCTPWGGRGVIHETLGGKLITKEDGDDGWWREAPCPECEPVKYKEHRESYPRIELAIKEAP